MAWQPDYVDITGAGEDIQEYLRIDDSADDYWLGLGVSAASRAVDRATRRQFGRLEVAAPRRYRLRWSYLACWPVADIDDLMSTDQLTVDGVPVTVPELYPLNAAADGVPWTQLAVATGTVGQVVTVSERWGWLAIPDVIEQATAIQAGRFAKRRDALFGIAGSPDAGSEMRLLARLDPDVAVLVDTVRRRSRPR